MSPRALADSRDSAAQRPLVPERIRPFARTPFYATRGIRARIKARVGTLPTSNDRPPIFIIGCGRSGTTLLGELFAAHPAVRYRYEPYHLWAAMEPTTDFLQLYSRGEHRCLLDAESVTDTARRRFRILMSAPPGFTFVEKSPINALRIGYVDAVAPDCHFVHIVRDGIDVVRSIARLAGVTRKMAFRPPLNEWWGVGNAKWAALERDGCAQGYYPDEVRRLKTDGQRGAYEWLVSLREVDRWRQRLGSRLVEIRYQDLVDDPRRVLRAVMEPVGLTCPGPWLDYASATVKPADLATSRLPFVLPDQMCKDFNTLQASFGFGGRATPRNPDDGPNSDSDQ